MLLSVLADGAGRREKLVRRKGENKADFLLYLNNKNVSAVPVLYAAPSRETYSRTNADENNPCTVFQP
jgi:hypothetical protein